MDRLGPWEGLAVAVVVFVVLAVFAPDLLVILSRVLRWGPGGEGY